MVLRLFTQILDMSLKGSFIIGIVLVARLLLKGAPRSFSYALWFVVLFRLLCPVSIISPFSLVPAELDANVMLSQLTAQTEATPLPGNEEIMKDIALSVDADHHGQSYIVMGDSYAASARFSDSSAVSAVSWIWFGGMAALAAYSIISYCKLHRQLIGAVWQKDGYYLADHISTPFVVGVFRPKIYLPSDLPATSRGFVLAHERQHIRRFDHVVKLAAFTAVCIHWFNPLVWLTFHLLVKDMEMSCDEAVLRTMGQEIRSDYSQLLLHLAVGTQKLRWTPLAFGEGDIGKRIRNVLSWKKPTLLAVAAALVLTTAVSVSALTDTPISEAFDRFHSLSSTQIDSVQAVRSFAPEDAIDLNTRQLQNLLSILQSIDEERLQPGQSANLHERLRVTIYAGDISFIFSYGYYAGEAQVFADINGEVWLVDSQPLIAFLGHMYLCDDYIELAHTDVPNDAVPYDSFHGVGCEMKLYHYYCGMCDTEGTAMSSFYCQDCTDCAHFWSYFDQTSEPNHNGVHD